LPPIHISLSPPSLQEIALGGKNKGVEFGDRYAVPSHIQALNAAAEAAARANAPLGVPAAALSIPSPGAEAVARRIMESTPVVVPEPVESSQKTRIIVLRNMVTEEDLASDDDYRGLYDEVYEECAKFGTLESMVVPRHGDGHDPSSVKKIFLEYANLADSARAEGELAGRKFGMSTVEVDYFDEAQYLAKNF